LGRPAKARFAHHENNDFPPADPRPLLEQLIELAGVANSLGLLDAGNFVATAIGEMANGQLSASPGSEPGRPIEISERPAP